MKNKTKNRIALTIILGTIGLCGAGLYLRERQKVEDKKEVKNKKKEQNEKVVREDADNEMAKSLKTLCISILKRENPPTSPEEFLRELVTVAMLGGEKLLEQVPRSMEELEDKLAEFKIYREYSRLCYSKLPGRIAKEKGVAVIVGKI